MVKNIYNIYNTVENITASSVFQGKVKKFSIWYIQTVKAITIKFLVWKNTTRKELHPLELTSKVTTEFAYNGTSRGLCQERYCRIEVISEMKCMQKGSSGPNKMQRYRRIDATYEAVINEFNYIEQIYKRFQASFGLN